MILPARCAAHTYSPTPARSPSILSRPHVGEYPPCADLRVRPPGRRGSGGWSPPPPRPQVGRTGCCGGSAPRDLPHLEALHDIAGLDVAVPLDDQTALEALADLGHVVLLAPQRGQVGALDDDRAVAQQPDLGVAADD